MVTNANLLHFHSVALPTIYPTSGRKGSGEMPIPNLFCCQILGSGQLKFLRWTCTIAPHHNTLRSASILKKRPFRQQQLVQWGAGDAMKEFQVHLGICHESAFSIGNVSCLDLLYWKPCRNYCTLSQSLQHQWSFRRPLFELLWCFVDLLTINLGCGF